MKKSTMFRSLLLSGLSMLLCVSMLMGSTFAWFTDTVESGINTIVAGNLDIELYHADKGTNGIHQNVDANTKLFDDVVEGLWEPGAMAYEVFTVENAGSLALKYALTLNVAEDTVVNGVSFASMLKVAVVEDKNFVYNRENIADLTNWQSLASFTLEGTLAADAEDDVYGIIIWWQPSDNDNLFNMNNGQTGKVSVTVGVNLFATQVEAESDSFGSDYDANAPIVSAPVTRPTTNAAINLKGAEDVIIGLPAAVIEALPDEVTEIGMSVSEPVVDATAKTITFATIELVDQDGKVIDLTSNTTPITVSLPLPEGATFAEGDTVVIYHDGEYVATAIVTGGVISYEVAHLCEVTLGSVVVPEIAADGTVNIGTVAELFGFAQSVNAGNYYEGKTVVLTKDIDLKNAEWTPIGSAVLDHGFMGNFDGNGKTISNLSIKSIKVDADGYAYAGFFGITEGAEGAENVIKDLTIKNVTINTKGAIVAAAIAYPYYTTVSNITVCGDIAINGGDYTAGVLAYTRRCTTASNITVNGNEGSYINGADTVGGVISDIQMNGGLTANYSNFSASNLTITGDKKVGGISGIIGMQTLNGATVKNVTLVCSDARVGIVSGSYDSKPVINGVTVSNVTGATAVAGAPWGSESNGIVTIDGVEYAGNLETFKAQLETGTVNLACNIALNETVTIASGKTVVINLNGNTISSTLSGTGNQDLFLVKGDLAINNGSIELTATQNQGWSAMSTIFDITAGGVVTLNKVVADNKGGTDMNFVAHLNNWGTATLNVTDSTLKATYVAVRVFNSGYDMNNVTIKNSTLSTTGNAAFWVHNYTAADFGTQEKADAQAKLLNFTLEGNTYVAAKAAFRYGMTNAEYYADNGAQVVTATTLAEVMAYAKNGNVIIDAQGANLGDFNYDGTFGNGTVLKNAKFTYVYGASVDGVATFENCEFVSDHSYSANFSDGSYTGKVIFNNCYFDGWNSFGTAITSVEMNNCTFETVIGPYSILRFYQDAVLNNCVIKDSFDGIDTNMAGTVVELNNCTGIEGKIYNNTEEGVVKVGTWIVDGVVLTDVPAW